MSLIVRYADTRRPVPAVAVLDGGLLHPLPVPSLGHALRLSVPTLRELVEWALRQPGEPAEGVRLLPPVDEQEVWAAGVTYRRSRDARLEESGGLDLYAQVYVSPRPELFFKCAGWRSVGPDDLVGVRRDARWSVPEPEVVVVANRDGDIVGFTVGNDVSSRDIEGDNPLYLPQAKVYTASCAVGPGIRPAWELPAEPTFPVSLRIERGGEVVMHGSTSTAEMVRSFEDLVAWLFTAAEFPAGVLLMTGTGIVPTSDLTLEESDVVVIDVEGIGELRNPATVVGRVPPSRPAGKGPRALAAGAAS